VSQTQQAATKSVDSVCSTYRFSEVSRRFWFDANNQITNPVDASHRSSSYFLTIATTKN